MLAQQAKRKQNSLKLKRKIRSNFGILDQCSNYTFWKYVLDVCCNKTEYFYDLEQQSLTQNTHLILIIVRGANIKSARYFKKQSKLSILLGHFQCNQTPKEITKNNPSFTNHTFLHQRRNKQLCIKKALLWKLPESKSVLVGSGYYNWLAMIGLDFYQDQENSLDILIKFQDEHQQPESHTHEELFLPITEISVTSHPTAPLTNFSQQPTLEEQSIANELIQKMRLACEEQEQKACLLLARMNAEKNGGSVDHQKMLQECPEREKEGGLRQKRKIIRKKHAE